MKENFMLLALKEAAKCKYTKDVPVGAIIVYKNKIIAKTHNTRNKSNIVLDHAEIKCVVKARKHIKDWRLNECEMYVTLEPCEMCKHVLNESRIKNVYYLSSKINNICYKRTKYNKINSLSNEEENYVNLLKNFFKKMR